MNLLDKSKRYGIACHHNTNHLYDDKPYEFHLEMVYQMALKFAHLVPAEKRDNFLAASWVHDVIEDCRQTYSDVLKATNQEVAELAFALTNEKGKNRKERANQKYYRELKMVPHAVLLKLCDRMANVEYSIQTKSRMYILYKNENDDFCAALNDGSCDEAFAYLYSLFN